MLLLSIEVHPPESTRKLLIKSWIRAISFALTRAFLSMSERKRVTVSKFSDAHKLVLPVMKIEDSICMKQQQQQQQQESDDSLAHSYMDLKFAIQSTYFSSPSYCSTPLRFEFIT
jgi:hypothetical protein